MASIKKLQMAERVISNPDVNFIKGFMGFGSKAVYVPTNSPIEAKIIDYTGEMGHRLKSVIETDESELEAKISKGIKLEETQIGNVHAEVCLSQDRKFVAVQVFAFSQLLFQPISEVKFFTGHAAQLVSTLFVK